MFWLSLIKLFLFDYISKKNKVNRLLEYGISTMVSIDVLPCSASFPLEIGTAVYMIIKNNLIHIYHFAV